MKESVAATESRSTSQVGDASSAGAPDMAQGVFNSVEERWEAGSLGLMRLMEFSLECLRLALQKGREGKLEECVNAIKRSSAFVEVSAKLMMTFGDIDAEEYGKFRHTRDMQGSATDRRMIDVHVMQRQVMTDLLRLFFFVLASNGVDTDLPVEDMTETIKEKPHVLRLTQAMIGANQAHKEVFGAHKWVCRKVVRKGEASLRGNYIEMFQNRDFAALLPLLGKALSKTP